MRKRNKMGQNEAGQKELSYHIFLFPFKWDYKASQKDFEDIAFERRTDIDAFAGLLQNPHWQRKPFTIDKAQDYNEFIYFYDFVRDALFDSGKETVLQQYEYEYNIFKESKYVIHLKDGSTYELNIDKILLNVYTTGVGILSYHLKNNKENYGDISDILRINEFGRRIYPQFLDEKDFTNTTKKAFLADRIEVFIDEEQTFIENFTYFDSLKHVQENPGKLSDTIMGLLGDRFFTKKEKTQKGDIYIEPLVDDRMFVMCWYADDKLCAELAKYKKRRESYNYTSNDDWYKFLFVDTKETTCKSIAMKEELLKAHTYDRWIDKKYGTLFGYSRYSFVVLTTKGNILALQHLKTMYFRMVNLVLVQRASILRFSHEVTHISALKKAKDTTKRISHLYERYIRFVNKVYFREVTAQEQGIELYDRIVQVIKIERDVKDLNREIDELHQYASLLEDKRKSNQLHILTVLGALFLVPAFLTGFFGMNIFSRKMEVIDPVKYSFIVGGIFLIPILLLTWLFLKDRWKDERMSVLRKIVLFAIPILVLLMVLFLVLGIDIFFTGVGP